ncbi:MAG: hypothetical protein ABI740_08415 [Alphaproteobacteria bacterium]
MSAHINSKRLTAVDIYARKGGDKLVALTAYHAPATRLVDRHAVFADARGLFPRAFAL